MAGPVVRGTVTPVASVFPAHEAQKASERVQATLSTCQTQLDQLHHFLSENTELINLVHRLPHDLHHPIMVPFGSAAFFPGKIIHTNELMVLLGEGYYAERTAKQTVDILKRRGKGLESQVEGVKAVMDDLQAEASFFHATAAEAAEGIVEIREDYVEESSNAEKFAPSAPKSNSDYPNTNKASGADEDEEYNRILSRLAALEKEEEEAEKGEEKRANGNEQDEDPQLSLSQQTLIERGISSEKSDGPAIDQGLAVKTLDSMENYLQAPAVKERLHNTQKEEIPDPSDPPFVSSSKNIIGSIVERQHNLQKNPSGEPAGGRSARPVSRFKQQRK